MIEGDQESFCNDYRYEGDKEQAMNTGYSQIKGLKASVRGFFGGYYNVEVNLTTLQVSWSFWQGGEQESFGKTIRPATAKKFLEGLKKVNLLNWRAEYVEPGVLDGTQWSVEIIRDGQNKKMRGNNQYPDEWADFCKLISRIAGKEFS
ncbi:hypothetical protein [Siminovitchia sp. 179-K 8D1 HS]|uniref:hypothetical protein n=1 Tax=Siminovitchia sp. 179-K 8D1 HS TaxID=3142385 RepID=UPI0039A3687E